MLFALRVLHVAVAAAWFGHKLLVIPDLRTSLDRQHRAEDLVGRLARAERLGIGSGLGTLVTGLVLLAATGFGAVSAGVYVGLGLVVGAIVLGATVARPASLGLSSAIGRHDLVAARGFAARLQGVLGAESLLWGLSLAAMLW